MTRGKKSILSLVTLVFISSNTSSYAAIPPQQHSLDLSSISPAGPIERTIKQQDIERVIPQNLYPGMSEEEISIKVIDHSANNFMNGDYFKNSSLGKAANNVQEALQTNVSWGGDPEEEDSIQHNMQFQLEAFQQKAWMKYQGYFDLKFTYEVSGNNLNIEMHEKLADLTDLVVTHNTSQAYSSLTVRWVW